MLGLVREMSLSIREMFWVEVWLAGENRIFWILELGLCWINGISLKYLVWSGWVGIGCLRSGCQVCVLWL